MVSMSKCNYPTSPNLDIVSEVHQGNTTSSSDTLEGPSFGYLVHFSDADGGVRMRSIRPSAYGLWPTSQAPY